MRAHFHKETNRQTSVWRLEKHFCAFGLVLSYPLFNSDVHIGQRMALIGMVEKQCGHSLVAKLSP
jgi:hypothetical protein